MYLSKLFVKFKNINLLRKKSAVIILFSGNQEVVLDIELLDEEE